MLKRSMLATAIVALLVALPFGVPSAAEGGGQSQPIYLNTSYTYAERAADLVARLTPTQRASQLVSSQAPEISSVANPLLAPSQAASTGSSRTSLAAPASAGDTTVKVSAITGMSVGRSLTLDSGGTPETVTITAVGTAAAAATTTPIPTSVGDTNVKVGSINGMAAGHQVRFDTGANLELATIASVGTAAGTASTLAAPAGASDTTIKVASISGATAGQLYKVDAGANLEIGTVASVGTAAGTATTLAAASAVGDTNIKVASITGMTVSHKVRVDTGANLELATIAAVGTAGSGGTGITLTAPLTIAHASGVAAQDTGTGITLTAPLTLAHAFGAAAQALGTGITLTAPLTIAHAAGSAVQDTGTGVTFTPALTVAHPFGAFADVLTGIPAYGWWNEALHGINAQTYGAGNATTLSNTTSYPIDLSRGASWDPALTYEVAKAESDEAREIVPQNKLNLDFYSPTVNIGRDPRWGRNDESYGEDPLLESKIASEFVDGMEGKDMNGRLLPQGDGFYKATTTLKHYALNNTEGTTNADPNGRLNVDTHIDERTLREYYTMAFRKIIGAAQNGAIMSSYNSVNGEPAAANTHLIDTLGRETFGFQGYYTGDCDAVNQISPRHHWQPAQLGHIANPVEQFAYTLGAGEDAECNAGYSTNSADNYRGPTSANTSFGGLMNAIGLHLTTDNGITNVNDVDVSATRMFTNRMKLGEFNADSTVPWLTQAVARDKSYGVYPWVNTTAPTETADRLALARRSADAGLVLLKNATITRKDNTVGKLLPLNVPSTGSFKVLVLGPLASVVTLGGYSSIQGAAGAANNVTPYAGIKAAIQSVNPAAQVDFLRGFTGTSNSASSCCGTIDPTAVSAAAGYDDVVVFTGIDSGVAAEDKDRTSLTLPGQQGQLIAQVAAVNPNTIGVMQGDPFDVSSFEPSTPALVWSSYNGQRQGEGLADVLLGTYNPSGRLPETFYQSADQLPPTSSYAIRPVGPTGRTYMYFDGPVAYPFGYGLSYTTFAFSNMHVSNATPSADDTIQVSVDVTNTGSRDGNEIVQMYVNTPNADPSLQRPLKRLEGFQKVFLAAGETKTVTLPIKIADLAFWSDADNRFEVDQGTYGIQISTSSADADIQQQKTIDVHGTLTQKPSVVTTRPRITDTDAARGITERVLFPEGVEIDPGVTVALNDDTLVGWVAPGQSKPLPPGLKLSFSSNRPDVVSVKGDKIRTVANGAATITATATYHGASASTTFVVRVLSDLTDLKVGGATVRGFNPDVFDYNVTLPPGATDVPQVAATALTGTVNVTQATGLPGVATVTSTGPEGIVATYTVNFSPTPSSDEFDGSALDSKWTVVRPNPANLAVGGGSLTITPEAGDLTTTSNSAKNLVLQPALGDWTMTSKLTFGAPPNAATQQGGIIAYQDDDNFLKFDLEATSATNIQLKTSLEDSFQTNPVVSANPIQVNQTLNTTPMNGVLPAGNTIWLRMTKQGSTYSTAYSLDGSTWVPVWTTGASLRNLKVGLVAFGGAAATGPQVAFDFIHLTVPAEQKLASLDDYVGVLGLDKGLTNDLQNKLDEALTRLGKGQDACHQLDEFLVKVLDQAGKPKLTSAQAGQLLYANEIEVDLGCLEPTSPVPQAEQDLLDLGSTIDGLGLDKAVADKLGNRTREAGKALARGDLGAACKQLSDLTKKIGEQADKGKLTSAQAAQLTADVAAISGDLGCSP